MNTTTTIHSFTIAQLAEVCDAYYVSYNEEDPNGRMVKMLLSSIEMAGWDVESAVGAVAEAAEAIKNLADQVIQAINENRPPHAHDTMAHYQARLTERAQEAEAKRAEMLALIRVAARSIKCDMDRRSFSKALQSVAFGSAS